MQHDCPECKRIKPVHKVLASSGLVLEFRSYQVVTQAILGNAQLAFHAAKSKITDVYFCFDHEFSALTGNVDPAGDGATTDLPWFNSGLALSDNRADGQKTTSTPPCKLRAVDT